ncbi:MAG: DUF2851 family protein [Paludibacteraceae bacterium]|nr:DUF2851 family protein [Paludibacteraceae bacterium]
MTEKLISYIWFNRLYFEEQQTLLGERVRIISPGIPNSDAGPDVFNAKVEINERQWAGNVEFHVRASDWHRHNHDGKNEYDNVILHVVFEADEQIFSQSDNPIPTIILRYPESILNKYQTLTQNSLFCPIEFDKIDSFRLNQWIDRLLIERLQVKTERIAQILHDSQNNWEQAFYVTLCRAFGFGVNSDAMQQVAKSLPLNIIMHHRDSIQQIEALLLGQAGFLNNIENPDAETALWQREYNFLKSKFSLQPINGVYFKFLRMRPASFPTMRLAQFAMLLHRNEHLFSKALNNLNIKSLREIFAVKATDYWATHYRPNHTSERHGCQLSPSSIDLLIINTIVPFLFLYAQTSHDPDLQEQTLDLLHQLRAERNNKVGKLTSLNFPCPDAYTSQALIQLHDNYCLRKDCLRCQLAHQYLKKQ